MIKIVITKEKKELVEEKYWELIKKHSSIIKNLNKDSKKLKKLCPDLYGKNGKLEEESFKNLIFADKDQMLDYIKKFKKGKKIELRKYFKFDLITRDDTLRSILKILDVPVCPYCNRQYTFTLEKEKVRPTLDHYFPKSEYPFLALSIWNLIPCCNICNLAKSAYNSATDTPILYPYKEGVEEDTIFHIQLKNNASVIKLIYGIENSFDVSVKDTEGELQQQFNKQVSLLHLQGLYNEHKAYILKLLKNAYINSEDRIEYLYQNYSMLFDSIEDVKNLVYMNDIREEYLIQNPLSKLTKDVIENLNIEFKNCL